MDRQLGRQAGRPMGQTGRHTGICVCYTQLACSTVVNLQFSHDICDAGIVLRMHAACHSCATRPYQTVYVSSQLTWDMHVISFHIHRFMLLMRQSLAYAHLSLRVVALRFFLDCVDHSASHLLAVGLLRCRRTLLDMLTKKSAISFSTVGILRCLASILVFTSNA